METAQHAPFQFSKLPKEIRVKIYKELFCNFKPHDGTEGLFNGNSSFGSFSDYTPVPNGQDTAILRTSKAIYEEAYDTLVKTNRFVHVTSDIGVPLQLLINVKHVAVVTGDNTAVDNFKSYVLAMHLDAPMPTNTSGHLDGTFLQQSNLMILHRDLGLLCEALVGGDSHTPGFSGRLQMSLHMAPMLDCVKPGETSPFLGFFSTEIQTALLAPMRATLRGYKAQNVKIQGHVDQDVARATISDMSQNRWSDPQQVLADLKAAKERGTTWFRGGEAEKAYNVWTNADLLLDKIHASSSWSALTTRGGEEFLSQIAETYLLARLNAAQVQLSIMQAGRANFMTASRVDLALKGASNALEQDYWAREYTYRASAKSEAKYLYRTAMF